MRDFSCDLIEKAKNAKTAEELLAIAKENGVEMTGEEAANYYTKLNPVTGELGDDELDHVSGGGCGGDDGRGAHAQLPGGTCSFCGAADPSGYYNYSSGHYGFSYYLERLDCCGNTMNLGHNEVNRLIKIN